jgi:hypothetical protein
MYAFINISTFKLIGVHKLLLISKSSLEIRQLLCINIYVYIYVHIYVYIYVYLYLYMHKNTHINNVYMFTFIYNYIFKKVYKLLLLCKQSLEIRKLPLYKHITFIHIFMYLYL